MALKTAVRLNDIARRARTSIATVSLALSGDPRISNETRRRIRELSQKLGYRPRRAMPSALKGTAQVRDRLRLALFAVDWLDRPYNAALLQALTQSAAASDVRVELASVPPETPADEVVEKAIQLGRDVDGLMLMGLISVEQLRQITHASVPAVMYAYPLGEPDENDLPVPVITSDFAGIGHRATRALIQSGHRRIAYVSGPLLPGGWHARCLDGYATAHLHSELELDRSLIFTTDPSAGACAARAVLSMEPSSRPTGYVAINTGTAAQFLRTMKDDGGITIRREGIVICGYAHLMHDFGLDGYPLVYMDPAKIAEAALSQLKSECIKRTQSNSTILVPFSTRDLPPAVDARGR